jgi:hypothetical protein
MPRKRKRERVGVLPEDKDLLGTWWRCHDHGLTQDPILLGGRSYCPVEECGSVANLVHSVLQDKSEAKRGWNDVVA